MSYIWQNNNWPCFIYDKEKIDNLLKNFLYAKGQADSTFDLLTKSSKISITASAIAQETMSSSEIEGETLVYDSVYSSVMKKLDSSYASNKKDPNSESVASMLFDARNNHNEINTERLLNWNRLLFEGKAKCYVPKSVGQFRDKPVYVVHHLPRGNDEVLYEAVPADNIEKEVKDLVCWINEKNEENSLAKSAIAGFWFVSIHPFEDGNGRISRAISDYVLSKDPGFSAKYYSISTSILQNKKEYYSILEKTQKQNNLDITEWVCWYIDTVTDSLLKAKEICSKKIRTSIYISNLNPSEFNSRQLQMLYKLSDDSFVGKLTADKWMKITKCQSSTATRDLSSLVEKGLLIRFGGSGKNYYYVLNPEKTESADPQSDAIINSTI